MPNGETHAGNRPALFSLPEAAPEMVLRIGELLKGSGHAAAAIEIYEHFIRNLRGHALSPVPSAAPGSATDDRRAAGELLGLLPVRAHPERYSFA